MTRPIPPGLINCPTKCFCWRLEPAQLPPIGFTDHDAPVTFGGLTYDPKNSFTPSALEDQLGLAVSNMEMLGALDSGAITDDQIRARMYDGTVVRVFLVDWTNPSVNNAVIKKGTFGQIVSGDLTYQAELRGLAQKFSQHIGTLAAQKCRARKNFGGTGKGLEDGCRIPLTPPVWTANRFFTLKENVAVIPTVANGWQFVLTQGGTTGAVEPVWPSGPDGTVVVDNTVQWVARRAVTRTGIVSAVTDRKHFTVNSILGDVTDNTGGALAGGFFAFGKCTMTTGNNLNVPASEIDVSAKLGAGTVLVVLIQAMPFDITIGDHVLLQAGCDGMVETCRDNYHNLNNYRAEPYMPGTDELFRVHSE